MLKSDPLSFLDESSGSEVSTDNDPLSFLDTPKKKATANKVKDQNDVLSFLDSPEETAQPEEKYVSPKDEKGNYPEDMPYWERVKHYFKGGEFGKANLLQMQSGGPAGMPATSPKQAARVATEVATIAAIEAAFIPIVGAAQATTLMPELLTAYAHLTKAFTTGTALSVTGKLVEEGELPTVEEALEHGMEWLAIDAILHTGSVPIKGAYDFGSAVRKIAKEEGIPTTKVLTSLWTATKNYVKSKFGRNINTPADITKGDVEILVDKVKQLEDMKTGTRDIEIDVTPKKEKVEPGEIGFEEKKQIEHKPEVKEVTDLEKAQQKFEEAKKNLNDSPPVSQASAKQVEGLIKEFDAAKEELNKISSQSTEAKPEAVKEAEKPKGKTVKEVVDMDYKYNPEKGRQELVPKEAEKPKIEDKTPVVLPEAKIEKVERQDISRKGLQEQKDWLIKQLDEAIAKTPEEHPTKESELLTFDIPGDGVMKIRNNKKALEQFRNSVDKKWPTKALPTPEKRDTRVQKLTPQELDEMKVRGKPEKPEKQKLSLAEITEQLKSFPGLPNKPSILNKNEILDSIPDKKYYVVNSALNAIESIKGRKSGEVDFDKYFELQKELIKYIEIGDFQDSPHASLGQKESNRQHIELREKTLEAKIKSFNNSLKKLQGTVREPIIFKSKIQDEVPEEAPDLQAKPRQTPPRATRPLRPIKGKKQAVARSKIINILRKAFNDPIRIGKIAQRNAAGIHKLWPKVTRLLKDNDIETVAHEIGHNLHTTLYGGNALNPKQQFANVERALAPFLGELQTLAHYAPWGMEGFAEFTRLYVTNPSVAQQLAPNFYKKFEADLEAQYPEMKNALLEARDYYDKWIQGTTQSRIRVHTSYAADKGRLASLIESLKDNFNLDKIKTDWLDDVFPAKRLVAEAFDIPLSEVENLKDPRNLYRSIRVLKGAVGKADVYLLHETFSAKTLDKINGSLKDILKQLKNEEEYRSFNDYLIARRSIEKAGQKIDTGVQIGDALDVEKDLRGKYGQLAIELDKYNDSLLRYAVDSGLLSGEQYNTIKKNNLLYTPFQRVMEKEKGGQVSGGGSVQASNPIKQMRGSTRDIKAPIESIIQNTYAVILNAEKNLCGQQLARLAATKDTLGQFVEALPTPIKLKGSVEGEQVARELAREFQAAGLVDLIELDAQGNVKLRQDIEDALPDIFLRFGAGKYSPGENIITVFEKGKPKYYEVSKPIYEMWNKGTSPYVAGLAVKIFRVPARTLRAGAVLNPKFMLKNMVRDTWGSWLFTKYGNTVKDPAGLFIDTLYSPLAMLCTSAKQGPLYVEWLKSGGGMSTLQSVDRDSVVKKLNEVRGKKRIEVIAALRAVAEISEEANRLVEFGKALEVEGRTRLGREIAAFAARDLSVDFAKMGLQVKAINQVCTFFNATIQGGDKYIRTLTNKKDRNAFIARNLLFVVLPSLWLWWLNKDDENMKEFQDQEKDFNFITKIHDGSYLKIPVPFEAGVIAHGLTQRMANHIMKKDPEAFEGFMGSVKDAMLPNLLPTLAAPFIETWANKSFFTGSRIIPRSQEDLISKYQYKNSTSSTARVIGRALTYMLGQDTRSKAASPAIIDHFINTWTGGLGMMIRKVTDASLEATGLSDKVEGPTRSTVEKLGLDAFIVRYPRAYTKSIEKFYDNYSDAMARDKSYKYAEKQEVDTPENIQAGYTRVEKIYDIKSLQMAYKAIQECQKEINAIWNSKEIDSDLKKVYIDQLYLQMIGFAKAANEEIRVHRLAG